jgi:2'-5' RNA ligase
VRLFVAVEIAGEVRDALAKAIHQLEDRIDALAPRARVNWTSPERIHLTVRFIGEIGPESMEALGEVLRPPLGIEPFQVTIAGTGVFPGNGPPRVVWAGIAEGLESLSRVEHEISSRLEKLGVPRESRPYRPHLTLARVRIPAGLRGSAFLEGTRQMTFGTTRVEETTLFESRLSGKGPTHVALSRTRLGAS